MSTEKQIEANRQNAQSSTGPVSETGKQTSSKNATTHGFTGQSIVVSPAEYGAYTAHVKAYVNRYQPASHEQEHLVQQLADLDWSLHQINVQQFNTISLMNAVHTKDDLEDPIATAKIIAGLARTLNNLNLYEVRRRRAARAVKEELEAAQIAHNEQRTKDLPNAVEIYRMAKVSGESFDPQEYGFVCSVSEIELYIDALRRRAAASAA